MARKKPNKRSNSGTANAQPEKALLDRLAPDEAAAVLRNLLKKHPELKGEAEKIAQGIVSLLSSEDIADEVFQAVTSIDLDDLNGRAGSHSWGYVGPGDAATELLEESLESVIDDMKRQAELGNAAGAEAICAGIVQGLYKARAVNSDGALGWAPDFPAEEAGHVVAELIRLSGSTAEPGAPERFLAKLAAHVTEWEDMLRLAADEAAKR